MASETITRNDLTAILNEVLPPTPSEYKKLLWTNPSPTSDFGAQTLTLDLSGYDEVEVYAGFINSSATTNMCGYFRAKVGGAGLIQLVNLDTANTSNASTFINIVSRQFQVSTTGITFTSGQMTYAGGAYANWGGRAVPFQIYGIKYERVNPPQVEMADCVIEEGTNGIWKYRKWNSGKIEAFASNNWGGVAGSVWVAPIYYKDLTLSIPSGIFPSTPTKVYATGNTNQWSIWGAWATSATQISLRCTTCATGGQVLSVDFYVIYEP